MILFLVSLCLCTHLLDDVIYPYAELEPGWIIVNVGAPSPGIICTGAKKLTIIFSGRGYGHVNFYGDYEFHIRPATALRLHSDLCSCTHDCFPKWHTFSVFSICLSYFVLFVCIVQYYTKHSRSDGNMGFGRLFYLDAYS